MAAQAMRLIRRIFRTLDAPGSFICFNYEYVQHPQRHHSWIASINLQ